MENVRLVCRAHNQYAAERAFGSAFMHGKRGDTRSAHRCITSKVRRMGTSADTQHPGNCGVSTGP